MSIRSAMRVLTDEQLHLRHTYAQEKISNYLGTGYERIMGSWIRQAKAAEREILSRGKYTQAELRSKKN